MNLLLDSAVKATVILFVAWCAARAMRRTSADARHMVWLIATLSVALLPAALSIPQKAIPASFLLVVPAVAVGPAGANGLPWLSMALLAIWAAGAVMMLGRLLAGIVSAMRITRAARTADGILYSERAAAPMTWGFLRPVVILPSYAAGWSDAERELVIRHERAHIARRDWLWQTLASVTTAVFWFHPLMWLANIQLRREAEGAVDDFVLANGAVAADYAGRLVDVARQLTGIATPNAVIPMVRKSELEMRVRSILDPARRRAGAGMVVRCAIVAAAVALVVPIVVTRQSVHAQGKVYSIGQGVTPPRIVYKEDPKYTQEAKDAKIQGTVTVKGVVATNGVAEGLTIVKGLDPGLDAQAITAVSNWRFQPGMKEGEPVPVYVMIEVNFHLL